MSKIDENDLSKEQNLKSENIISTANQKRKIPYKRIGFSEILVKKHF